MSILYLNTACTVVNNLGLAFTKLVNMNSNLLLLNLVITNNACVFPRKRLLATLILMLTTQSYPIPGNRIRCC